MLFGAGVCGAVLGDWEILVAGRPGVDGIALFAAGFANDIALLTVAGFGFRREKAKDFRIGTVKAGLLAAVLYAPWFGWVWSYYGQPIPNTVLAKSTFTPDMLENPAVLVLRVLDHFLLVSTYIFLPIYYGNGGWPSPIMDFYAVCSVGICTAYWIIPSGDRLGRLASLMFLLTALYLSFVDLASISCCPWYMTSSTVFGTFVLARAMVEFCRHISWMGLVRDVCTDGARRCRADVGGDDGGGDV